MLGLRLSVPQVVGADERLGRADVLVALFGKGHRPANPARHALSERMVEALDGRGGAGQCADGARRSGGHHAVVYPRWLRVARGVLTLRVGHHRPQLLEALTAAVPHRARNDLAGCGVPRQPEPRLVVLVVHEAGPCGGFPLKTWDPPLGVTRDRWDLSMVRC